MRSRTLLHSRQFIRKGPNGEHLERKWLYYSSSTLTEFLKRGKLEGRIDHAFRKQIEKQTAYWENILKREAYHSEAKIKPLDLSTTGITWAS